jgi:hypothetical protein
MGRALAERLATLALTAAAAALVGVPVIAGFWSRDAVDARTSTPGATVIHCLDLRQPGNMDKVRRLPRPDLARYIVACNLTYTKDCSGAGTVDTLTGKTIYDTPPTCVIRDKRGNVVRTYTTDVLRPTP